eukprot:TRINITY_DN12340_c0_g1_i1.p2 TRINITY_DN12340_c0_g1~~TRINITY_DN12340_c0_g1_i1.p2  ORF type:complete len:82 (-),score=11.02 TRINITY_DN12340_c0_g1_i1:115-360(-)
MLAGFWRYQDSSIIQVKDVICVKYSVSDQIESLPLEINESGVFVDDWQLVDVEHDVATWECKENTKYGLNEHTSGGVQSGT